MAEKSRGSEMTSDGALHMLARIPGERIPAIATMLLVFATQAASAQTVVETTYRLVFQGPGDVFTFELEKVAAAGDLIVDTRDAGMAGDKWQVDIFAEQPANAENDATAVGNGSLQVFSGDAISQPFIHGEVDVYYEAGINIFPARMDVRFRYTGADGIHITPVVTMTALSTSTADSATLCLGENC